MLYVDRVIQDQQVLHRSRAAKLSSRATLMRRVRQGVWVRPTSRTVALKQTVPDDFFEYLVAAANVWPDGGITGTSLTRLAHGKLSASIETARPRRVYDADGKYVVYRRQKVELAEFALPSGRILAVDVSASSLIEASTDATPEEIAWTLIRCLARTTPARRRVLLTRFGEESRRIGHPMANAIKDISVEIAGGAESAGEVYVGLVLRSLGVAFDRQHVIGLDASARSALGSRTIRTDFLLQCGVILEVDSQLHDHVRDVRRDMWNLEHGRRTLRVVGQDVVADPVRARQQLARLLAHMQVPMNPSALSPWMTAA
jgi:very-short-patch-repair endonuclease